MANQKELNDEKYTAASWDYDLGSRVEVTNTENGRKVQVEITDRGPNRALYRAGRILDLSKAAFAQIADLEQGIIEVRIRLT